MGGRGDGKRGIQIEQEALTLHAIINGRLITARATHSPEGDHQETANYSDRKNQRESESPIGHNGIPESIIAT